MMSYYQYCKGKSKVFNVVSATSVSKQRELQDSGVTLRGVLPPMRHVITNLPGGIGRFLPVCTVVRPPLVNSKS